MHAGSLTERVELLPPGAVTVASDGSAAEGAVTAVAVWARVVTSKGAEAFQAVYTRAERTIRVQMRWRADVTTAWRLRWQGQIYDVWDVDASLRRRGELWVTATVRGGPL